MQQLTATQHLLLPRLNPQQSTSTKQEPKVMQYSKEKTKIDLLSSQRPYKNSPPPKIYSYWRTTSHKYLPQLSATQKNSQGPIITQKILERRIATSKVLPVIYQILEKPTMTHYHPLNITNNLLLALIIIWTRITFNICFDNITNFICYNWKSIINYIKYNFNNFSKIVSFLSLSCSSDNIILLLLDIPLPSLKNSKIPQRPKQIEQ